VQGVRALYNFCGPAIQAGFILVVLLLPFTFLCDTLSLILQQIIKGEGEAKF
jgi:hypothetical protein